jgi:tetratricopeptide (TPR) repeat protein
MEVIFKRITEAYETLGKKKRRAEYDKYIAIRLKTLRAERELEKGRKAAEEMARQAAEGKIDPSSHPPPPPPVVETGAEAESAAASATEAKPTEAKPTEAKPAAEKPADEEPAPAPAPEPAPPELERRESDGARQRRRQLMARKLAAAAGRRLPGQAPPQAKKPASKPATATSKKQLLKGLTSSLKATASFTGGVDLAQRYLQQAKAQEEAGDVMAATNSLRLALALAPDRPDIEEHYERLAFELAQEMAADYVTQAKYEEENGKWGDAALSWAKVGEGRPEDTFPHWRAAKCILKASGDLKQARGYAQRAVELDPDDFDAQKTLGLVFHAAGMADSARRALQAASALDSRDEMVENLLRELKK